MVTKFIWTCIMTILPHLVIVNMIHILSRSSQEILHLYIQFWQDCHLFCNHLQFPFEIGEMLVGSKAFEFDCTSYEMIRIKIAYYVINLFSCDTLWYNIAACNSAYLPTIPGLHLHCPSSLSQMGNSPWANSVPPTSHWQCLQPNTLDSFKRHGTHIKFQWF